ncbi:MAG: SPFH domain-containing protein [Candidatus Pacebacteria bacterium]|nr:SPFH domain-containing protein [Candidatus Paceibacterota bacterium]
MKTNPEKTEKTKKSGKKTEQEQEENEFIVFLKGLVVIFAPLLTLSLVYFILKWWSPWNWLAVFPYVPISAGLVLYFYWAKHEVIGYFIEEGYCIIFAWGGESLAGADLRYTKHYFNENWDVVTEGADESKEETESGEKKRRSFLGIGFYLWPFQRIFEYDMTWAKKTEKGERISKTEKLRRILLKPYVYSFEYQNMEDADRMPVNIDMAMEIQIKNPIKALFGIEKWYRAVLNLTEGDMRTYVGRSFYRDMVRSGKDVGEQIKHMMENTLKGFRDEYGVQIRKIKVGQIVPSRKEDVEATLKAMQAERERERVIIAAQAEAFKIGQELEGAVMQALSIATGVETEKLQEEREADPGEFGEKYKAELTEAYDFAKRRMAFDRKGRFEIITSKEGDGCDKEGGTGPDGGINTSKLIEVVAGVEMARQALPQKAERTQAESTKDSSSDKKQAAVKKLKEDLGYKY